MQSCTLNIFESCMILFYYSLSQSPNTGTEDICSGVWWGKGACGLNSGYGVWHAETGLCVQTFWICICCCVVWQVPAVAETQPTQLDSQENSEAGCGRIDRCDFNMIEWYIHAWSCMHACHVFPVLARLFNNATHWWMPPKNPAKWMLMTGSFVLSFFAYHITCEYSCPRCLRIRRYAQNAKRSSKDVQDMYETESGSGLVFLPCIHGAQKSYEHACKHSCMF